MNPITNPIAGSGLRATRRPATNALLIALLPLIAAIALLPGLAGGYLLTVLTGGTAHATFGNSVFTLAPSTTQAAAHPNLTVTLDRSGTESEDIKNIIVDLPPGLLGNPESVPSKCSNTLFSFDLCGNSQQVGTISVNATALGFLPLSNIPGAVYVLSPASTSAATLGYVLRPIGSQVGIINKAYMKNEITVRTSSDFGLKNSHLGVPTSTAAVVLLPVPITITRMALTLQSRAGKANNLGYFMLASSRCQTSQSKLTMTSVQNVTLTRYANYTPTNCAAVPLNPTFAMSVDNNDSDEFTGGPIIVSQGSADAPIQQSTVSRIRVEFPAGTGLNFARLGEMTGCTGAQFNSAAGCPDTSKVGTASAFVHMLPPTFTGKIFALGQGGGTTIGSTVDLGIVVSGARGLVAKLRGTATVIGEGSASRVVADFNNLPEFPLSNLTATFTEPLLRNPQECGWHTVTTEVTGHSGAQVTRTSGYTIDDCPPETTITPDPDSPTKDTTPAISFESSEVGSTFECTFDSSTVWTPCVSGQEFGPLAGERDHLFRVRACREGTKCDYSPAESSIRLDLTPPDLTITSPTPFETVLTGSVAVKFETDGERTRCSIDDAVDDGDWFDCGLSSYQFDGVAPGPHTIYVTAYDEAGNDTPQQVAFERAPGDCVDLDPEQCKPEVEFTAGPQGGLGITDLSPTYDFAEVLGSVPARGFECRIDGGDWFDCASGLTLPDFVDEDFIPLYGAHDLDLRAWGDNTRKAATTGPIANAHFVIATYDPDITAEYYRNDNNAVLDRRASQHPDVEVTLDNPAGDPDSAQFVLPNGFWGSLGAVPDKCTLTELEDGACDADSKVGTVEVDLATDRNELHTFTSDVFMVASSQDNDADLEPEELASIGGNLHVAFDGKDYGYIREDAMMSFSARYIRDNPAHANTDDPRGMDAITTNVPERTLAHPGPDGSIKMHLRGMRIHFDGDTGLSEGRPLITAPSNCEPNPAYGISTDKEGNFWSEEIPYQAEECDQVLFEPSVFQEYTSIEPNTATVPKATVTVPDGQSSFRKAVIELPYSVQPHYSGLADKCSPFDTRLIPPACDEEKTMVGTVTIETPLLPYPVVGKIFLESSGGPLPNGYIYIYDPVTDLDVRIRASIKTIGTPSHLVLTINAESNGDIRDAPDVPISSLYLELPGSAANGPVAEISTDCRRNDTTGGDIIGWTGAVSHYSQTIGFSNNCPNP